MNQRQQLFSEFFKTMIKMRKILEETMNIPGESKVNTLLQMQALEHIQKNSKISAGELASMLNMSPSALTQLIDRMIDTGLINRVRSKTDRRSVYVSLTKNGKLHFQKSMKLIENKTSKILEPIAEDDLKEIVRIFNDFLEKHDANSSVIKRLQ